MKSRPSPLVIDAANPFALDALGRKPLAEFLERFIESASGPFVVALDSPWGTGKTTLVQMVKARLEQKKFRCLYFNAWEVDYASDPLIALVTQVKLLAKNSNGSAQRHLKKLKSITTLVAKRGLIATVKAGTLGALDLEKELEAALSQGVGDASADLFDLVAKEGECLAVFKSELEKFVDEAKSDDEKETLVFFIDELDRCRPSFAIELLERIKHLFDAPNIVFVLSIDKAQLEISTASVYGVGINSREYLRRFIDLELSVPQVSGKAFVERQILRFGLDEVFSQRSGELRADRSNFVDAFALLAKATRLSLRAQENCIGRLALIMSQLQNNTYLFPLLAATLLVVRTANPPLFNELRSGIASTEEVMAWLRQLGVKNAFNNRIGYFIEATLNAADSIHSRKQVRVTRLTAIANDQAADGAERMHASEVLAITFQLGNASYGGPNMAHLLSKMDLIEELVQEY
jgi:hypothetical protein